MLSTISINDSQKWDKIVTSFKNYDIYYLSGYVKANQFIEDGNPTLIYYENEKIRVINVVNIRDIAKSKFFNEKIPFNTYFDMSTPYGYGGFLVEGEVNKDDVKQFYEEYSIFCKENRIISEFIRFNPLLNNHTYFTELFEISFNRETIFIDLESEEIIWNNMKSTSRNRIRNAQKMKIMVEKDNSIESMNNFIKLYYKTMEKNNADNSYYFNKNYFEQLLQLKGECEIFNAVFNGKVIASMIVLAGKDFIHYHLGATDPEYYILSPNNLLFYEVAKWGSMNGYKYFHLGGGYSSSNDGLFRFKKTLNKHGTLQFFIGKIIWNMDIYEKLLDIRKIDKQLNNTAFFPTYRIYL